MFVKTVKDKKAIEHRYIVESSRSKIGKSIQKVLLDLGKIEEGKIEQLIDTLTKLIRQNKSIPKKESMRVKSTYELGQALVLRKIYSYLEIDRILREINKEHSRLGFDLELTVFTMIVCRFLEPSSKLSMYEYLLPRIYPELINSNIRLHQLYVTLDLLNEHTKEIEEKLLKVRKDKLKLGIDIVLYDLTTLRFESTKVKTGELCRKGNSKDKRYDCTQVVLGLVLDPAGLPITQEVFPGNTFEGKTIEPIIKKLKNKYSINKFIFIADRGLCAIDNLKLIEEQGEEYIIGLKLSPCSNDEEKYYDKTKFTWVNKEFAFYKTSVYVGKKGKRKELKSIITWSKKRDDRDKSLREEYIKKQEEKVAKGQSSKDLVQGYRRKFLKGFGSDKLTLDYEAIEKASKRDGFFAMAYNTENKSPQQIFEDYKSLWIIEDAFGELKGYLKTRPIYHWTDKRIRGHIVLCFLAYYCEAYITKVLREVGFTTKKHRKVCQITVPAIMEELKNLKAIPLLIGNVLHWLSTEPTANVQQLFKIFNINLPLEILKEVEK